MHAIKCGDGLRSREVSYRCALRVSLASSTTSFDLRSGTDVLHERKTIIAAGFNVRFDSTRDRCGVGFTKQLRSSFCNWQQANNALFGFDDSPLPFVEVNAERLREPTRNVED